MSIDWVSFSPGTALAGGMLIGVACTLLLLGIGRIAGISGILGGLLGPINRDIAWRLAFVAGLIIAPTLLKQFFAVGLPDQRALAELSGGLLHFVLGGILVGVGTRLANGCASGHGICGLGRFSGRSLVAVILFMGTAMTVVYVLRHVLGDPR